MAKTAVKYDEKSIQTLDALEHIRLRTGMYIGRLGDGSNPMDGIYISAEGNHRQQRRRVHHGPGKGHRHRAQEGVR